MGNRIDFVKAEMKGNRMAVFVVDDLGMAMAIQKLNGRKFNGKAVLFLVYTTRSHSTLRFFLYYSSIFGGLVAIDRTRAVIHRWVALAAVGVQAAIRAQ